MEYKDFSLMQTCRHCYQEYVVSVPLCCCKDCFLKHELKYLLKMKEPVSRWARWKRGSYIMILIMVPLTCLGWVCGFEVEIIAMIFMIYGSINCSLVDWLCKKF